MSRRIVTWSDYKKHAQKFDDNEYFIKYGKKIKIQDYINESADEVNIDTILKKYGAIPDEKIITEEEIITDLTGIKDLRSLEDQRNKVKEIFYNLPTKVRKQFKNNVYEFEQNGLDFFTKKHNEKIKKYEKWIKEQQNKQKQEENNNVEK